MQKVRKAIFPVGGLGTRFLPATKSMPKEMLPVASKPLIQYAFEEARDAGIEEFIFIMGRNKNAISNHFDHSYELQTVLSEKDKKEELSMTRDWVPEAGHIAFIRQQQPLGLGHAVWCARHYVKDEPFAVLLADEMLQCEGGFLKEMTKYYEQVGGNLIAVADIDKQYSTRYGMIDPNSDDGSLVSIKNMVEKPSPEDAPSNISITGRYILQPEIFKYLENAKTGAGGEIQLTDAMQHLLKDQKFWGVRHKGPRFDCGNRQGFLEANIAYEFAETKDKEALKEMLKKYI